MIHCEDCRFFDGDDHYSSNGGKCHRYPPTVTFTTDSDGYTHRFYTSPKVLSDNFCGEAERADAQAASLYAHVTPFALDVAHVLADAAYDDAMESGDGEAAHDAYLYTVAEYLNGKLVCTCRDMHPDDDYEACEVCRAEALVRARGDGLPF